MAEPLVHPEFGIWTWRNVHDVGVPSPSTNIDILEIHLDSGGNTNVEYKEKQNEEDISLYLQNRANAKVAPTLTVFFFPLQLHDLEAPPIAATDQTLEQIQEHFHLSPQFSRWLGNPHCEEPDLNSYSTKTVNKPLPKMGGFYVHKIASGAAVYYLHDTVKRHSTYFLACGSETIKTSILSCARGSSPHVLLRLCAIEVIVATVAFKHLCENSNTEWNSALDLQDIYDDPVKRQKKMRLYRVSPESTINEIFDIHFLAMMLSTYICRATEFESRLDHILELHQKLSPHFALEKDGIGQGGRATSVTGIITEHTILESLERLKPGVRERKLWLEAHQHRVGVHINLLYSLRAQEDNRVDLEIARLTSGIAVDAQRDSASMITIAAMTMFFLPGTFVSAIFSVVFFSTTKTAEGGDIFNVSSQWWLFVAVTIPLTIAIMGIWLVWSKRRQRKFRGFDFNNASVGVPGEAKA